MKSLMIVAVTIAIASFVATPDSGAAQPVKERPELLKKLIDCRAIADGPARLACYDERVGALDVAERKEDVVVVDRAGMREARKSLFGLSLPSFKLFDRKDGGDKEKDEVRELETTIASVATVGGAWQFTLADGARWIQTDENMIAAPKAGQPIRIRQGAMGSYLANVNKQVAIRVRRVN